MAADRDRYLNRELSWLEFNQRVLDEAADESVPLLERLFFLAITASNLDEFFMVRVGGLHLLSLSGSRKRDPSGRTPNQQLRRIVERAHTMVNDQYACYRDKIEPALRERGIRRLTPEELSEEQAVHARRLFADEISAVVTPLAVREGNPFPLLAGLGLHLAVRLAPEPGSATSRFAVIPVGAHIQRFITVPAETGYCFLSVEDLLAICVDRLFPGEEVLECVPFRITRNADLAVDDEFAADLLAQMESVLVARKESACVRLDIGASASDETIRFLRDALGIRARDVYAVDGPINLADFRTLAHMDGYDDLKYEPWRPQAAIQADPDQSIFSLLTRRSILLCHPYDSFDPVLRLLEEAVADPDVLAIKQILYRTSRGSPVVAALKRAAAAGKYVTALVELKARFDEARNIEWARDLERSGVQVFYGVRGLKTHAKLLLIVRREPRGIVRYAHFGTGNYNETTAALYTDVSYLVSDEILCADASAFLNSITGYSQPPRYLKLAAAPVALRDTLLELIAAEAERKRHGQQARIVAKMNSLTDPELIDALYDASRAGVTVQLNVRGICCLRPGVKGLSENITVVSIVDRFLEHSRIFYFRHGGNEKVFLSSADWMPRNLDRRVELLVPVDDKAARKRLVQVLTAAFKDTVKARRMLPDGTYTREWPGRRKSRSQAELYRQACRRLEPAPRMQRTMFEPHGPVGNGA